MKLIFLFLGAILATSSQAQSDLDQAKENLQSLKNGMLLVRLQTRETTIKALKELDREEEAREVKQEQYEENKETLLSFTTFDFCPVYFFYADKSEEIQQGNLSGHIFDNELNIIKDTRHLPEKYFVGEFGETARLAIDGFVLMDSDLIPLESPFPFYQRKYTLMGIIALSKGQMIERYNKKLRNTYDRWF